MNNPICLSPLKFYSSVDKQNRHRSFAYGDVSPLIVYGNWLPAFQFVLPEGAKSIIRVFLNRIELNTKLDITANATLESGLKVIKVEDFNLVTYSGIFPLSDLRQEGYYYLEIETNTGETFVSEVFSCTNNVDDCLKIEYSSPVNLELKNGIVSFKNGFKFSVYLRTELGKPEYKFEEEATKRLGYTFIESQVSKKIYKFNAILPEYLCDALRLIRLCPDKKLTSKGETYDMLSFDMDVDWQDQGNLASVNCEFQVDNIIVNLGGISQIEQSDPGHGGGGSHENGSFNGDFNNDFN